MKFRYIHLQTDIQTEPEPQTVSVLTASESMSVSTRVKKSKDVCVSHREQGHVHVFVCEEVKWCDMDGGCCRKC